MLASEILLCGKGVCLACYLKRAARDEKTQAMMSLGVSDAFLTVKQETPTVVSCVDATGRKQAEFYQGSVMELYFGTVTSRVFSKASWTWRR